MKTTHKKQTIGRQKCRMRKPKLLPVYFAILGLLSCKSTQLKHTPTPETGMFKVSILYPAGEGKTFDMDYYEKTHMPMMAGLLGNNLKFYQIDKGIGGRTPGSSLILTCPGDLTVVFLVELLLPEAPVHDEDDIEGPEDEPAMSSLSSLHSSSTTFSSSLSELSSNVVA